MLFYGVLLIYWPAFLFTDRQNSCLTDMISDWMIERQNYQRVDIKEQHLFNLSSMGLNITSSIYWSSMKKLEDSLLGETGHETAPEN